MQMPEYGQVPHEEILMLPVKKFYENNYIANLTAKKDNLFGKWGGSLAFTDN
jgi:hypothetical protein